MKNKGEKMSKNKTYWLDLSSGFEGSFVVYSEKDKDLTCEWLKLTEVGDIAECEAENIELGMKCNELRRENEDLKNTLNRIGMLCRSELAYTSDFTEQVKNIVATTLGNK
jgi:hypothetical protein